MSSPTHVRSPVCPPTHPVQHTLKVKQTTLMGFVKSKMPFFSGTFFCQPNYKMRVLTNTFNLKRYYIGLKLILHLSSSRNYSFNFQQNLKTNPTPTPWHTCLQIQRKKSYLKFLNTGTTVEKIPLCLPNMT